MRIYLRENFCEVNVGGRIRTVERDEDGLFYVEGTEEESKTLDGIGLTASRDELLTAIGGEVDYVVKDELDAGPPNPEVAQKLKPTPNPAKKGEPYFCAKHAKMHAPGSSEYLACFPASEKPPAKPKK